MSYSVILVINTLTGLVKDLDMHQYDYASKFLTSHGTYILLEKQLMSPGSGDLSIDMDAATNDTDGTTTPGPPQYTYNPLLEKCSELFPGYRLHVAQTEKKKKQARSTSKSPSPAGLRPSKTAKNKQPMNRSPSKRRWFKSIPYHLFTLRLRLKAIFSHKWSNW